MLADSAVPTPTECTLAYTHLRITPCYTGLHIFGFSYGYPAFSTAFRRALQGFRGTRLSVRKASGAHVI